MTDDQRADASNAKKIIIAEDDKFLSRAMADKLSRLGFLVMVAGAGNEALEKIKTEKPDLVLLDLMMPQKSGFEVLADLKLDKNLAKIPVMVMSNLGQDSDIKKAKDLGAVDYFVKSNIQMKKVAEKIKEYFAAHS